VRFAAVMRDTVRSPRFAVASDTAGWTWCKAYTYAAEIEQGGRIPGAAKWTNAQWMAIAQIKAAGLRQAVKEGLLLYEGGDVIVVDYDVDGETKVAAMRDRAQRNGARSNGRPRNPVGNPAGNPVGKPVGGPSAVSDPVTVTGGRGSPSPNPLRGSRPDDPRVEAVAAAYRARFGGAPPWSAHDIEEHLPALAPFEPEVVGEVARRFFEADGARLGDGWWRKHGWTLHLLTGQALEMFAAPAQEAIAGRRADAQRLRADEDRRAAEKAAADEQAQRAAAELAALPPPLRAWRLALEDLGGRAGAVLGHARPELAGDRLVVRLEPDALKMVRSRSAEIEEAFTRRAGADGPRLWLTAAVEAA
jgi:hypothetical protein